MLGVDIPQWQIVTVVGTGASGFAGDGGFADLARISEVRDLALDDNYNLWIADTFNHRIRLVSHEAATIVRGSVWIDEVRVRDQDAAHGVIGISFAADGGADPAELMLRDDGGRRVRLRILPFTGEVRVEELEE